MRGRSPRPRRPPPPHPPLPQHPQRPLAPPWLLSPPPRPPPPSTTSTTPAGASMTSVPAPSTIPAAGKPVSITTTTVPRGQASTVSSTTTSSVPTGIGLPPPPAGDDRSPGTVPAVDVPPTPASLVGAMQGRVAQLLTDLLTRGVRTPVQVKAPSTRTAYRGADAELLRLQEEVIALALEALGTRPPEKKEKPQ